MSIPWARREFLVAAGATSAAAVLGGDATGSATPPPLPVDGPAYLAGDPYLATVDGPGLGGGSFDEARARAFRFRLPAAHRDSRVLELELPHA